MEWKKKEGQLALWLTIDNTFKKEEELSSGPGPWAWKLQHYTRGPRIVYEFLITVHEEQ